MRPMSGPSPTYRVIALLSRPLVFGLFRLEARGRERLPGSGFVLAANHLSNLDPWALGIPLFPHRWLRFMAKSELYWWPLGPLLNLGGAFPVRRGEGDVEAIAKAVELARVGEIVVMFPEGTRRKKGLKKTRQARPHTGAVRVAMEAGVPLVPAALAGTDRLSRLGPLRVAYGTPVELGDLRDRDVRKAAEIGTERLMAAIAELEQAL